MICLFLTIEQGYRVAEALPELRDLLSEVIAREELLPRCDEEPELVIYYGKHPLGGWNSEEVYDRAYADQLVKAMQTAHRLACSDECAKQLKAVPHGDKE